ncbi:MAG: HD domain-containing phosphohydrolase [Pseudomonadota bacterium]
MSGDDQTPARTGEFQLQKREILTPGHEDAAESSRLATNPDHYPEPGSFDAELKRARQCFGRFRDAGRQMIDDVRVGRPLNTVAVAEPLEEVVASIIRHPDPMVWMTHLLEPQSFLNGHLLRTSVLAAVLGRGMGLSEVQLKRLAWSGLLCQIGKAKLPRHLLEKPGPLTEEEITRIHTFVNTGAELVARQPDLDAEIAEIVRTHHERFDGSGYPNGLKADQIPMLARLVGIVDWYDTMTSIKPYSDVVVTSTEAIDALNQERDRRFHDQVVEEFVRVIGLYPNGSLVELDSGEIGVVQAQNVKNRTQPRLLLMLDEKQQKIEPPQALDLLSYNQDPSKDPKTIHRALPDGEFGLDPATAIANLADAQGFLAKLRKLRGKT